MSLRLYLWLFPCGSFPCPLSFSADLSFCQSVRIFLYLLHPVSRLNRLYNFVCTSVCSCGCKCTYTCVHAVHAKTLIIYATTSLNCWATEDVFIAVVDGAIISPDGKTVGFRQTATQTDTKTYKDRNKDRHRQTKRHTQTSGLTGISSYKHRQMHWKISSSTGHLQHRHRRHCILSTLDSEK